jgi:hypothetical protein
MKIWKGRTMELHSVTSAWYQKSLAYLYYFLGMKLIKLESTVKYKYKNTDLPASNNSKIINAVIEILKLDHEFSCLMFSKIIQFLHIYYTVHISTSAAQRLFARMRQNNSRNIWPIFRPSSDLRCYFFLFLHFKRSQLIACRSSLHCFFNALRNTKL